MSDAQIVWWLYFKLVSFFKTQCKGNMVGCLMMMYQLTKNYYKCKCVIVIESGRYLFQHGVIVSMNI
jgi:hypothetical protein